MPKPKTKIELLELSQKNFQTLMTLVNSYTAEEQIKEFPKGTLNRNIKDVLAHLHEWHAMLLVWYEVGLKGEKPDMPAKGYTWNSLPDLNNEIWKKHKDLDIQTAKRLLQESYKEIQVLIQKHTDEELFEKKKFNWTGSTSLGAYLISNTSSHYHWAIQFIKKSMKHL